MNENDLKAMALHEKINFLDFVVLRVVGGWVYTKLRLDHNQMNSVFVPEVKQ